jgi:antitoxin HicB
MERAPRNKFELTRLTEKDGGGWLISFPDLPGCLSDGDTIEEAVNNGVEAEKAWLAATEKWGRPKPKSLVARLPHSLHRDLAALARYEGVSLNTLLVTLLSRGLGAAQNAGDR